jgi:hypothetical protein
MTRCDGVVTSTGGEAAPDKKNGGDDVSWADTNLTGPKIKKINAVNSPITNGRWRFKSIMS